MCHAPLVRHGNGILILPREDVCMYRRQSSFGTFESISTFCPHLVTELQKGIQEDANRTHVQLSQTWGSTGASTLELVEMITIRTYFSALAVAACALGYTRLRMCIHVVQEP